MTGLEQLRKPDHTMTEPVTAVHEHYVRAINDAVDAGRDADVYELAAGYHLESRPETDDLAA